MSTADRNEWNRQLRRCLVLATLSSAAFVMYLLAETSNSLGPLVKDQPALEGAIVGSTFIIAFLLFGAFVLVPHVPEPKRHPVRIAAIVALPFVWLWPAGGIGYGLATPLKLFLNPNTDLFVIMAYAGGSVLAGAVWVLGLAALMAMIAKLEKRQVFWRYATFAAAGCAIPISLLMYILQECLLGGCSEWADSAIFFLMYFVVIVTPAALTSALHFGTGDQSTEPPIS